MKSRVRLVVLSALALAADGCAGRDSSRVVTPVPTADSDRPVEARAVAAPPPMPRDTTSVSGDMVDYDEVGHVGRGDAERDAQTTPALEEAGVAAMHRTLPIPSFVEVTRLDTGRTILVRVVARGPADTARTLALSSSALAQLGVEGSGPFAARIRRTNPVESERAALREGQGVPARVDTPESLLEILRERAARLPRPPREIQPVAPTTSAVVPRPSPAPIASPIRASAPVAGGYIVQIGAYSDRARADGIAERTGATVSQTGRLFRVRYAPVATRAEAEAAIARARAAGQPGAIIVRER